MGQSEPSPAAKQPPRQRPAGASSGLVPRQSPGNWGAL